MQLIKATVRQQWLWVCRNKPFWFHASLWGITLIFVFVRPAIVDGKPTDLPVRFWGMFLQLIGAYTVWADMTSTARDFGETPSLRKTWEWFKSLFHKPQTLSGSMSASASSSSSATARLSSTFNPHQPLDVRTTQLEQFVQNLDTEIVGIQTQIRAQRQELSSEITMRTAEVQRSLGTVQHQLRDALVGNYTVLRFGAIWLVIGIVLSSVAVEITNFFHLNHQLPAFW